MTWRVLGSVRIWEGDSFPDPGDDDLSAYRFCAVPVAERQHSSCGKPGSGRSGHDRRNEPVCDLCTTAERLYSQARRASAAS